MFVDDEQLHNFLDLNEEGKMQFSPAKYAPCQNEILDILHFVWKVDKKFEGDYISDYEALRNGTKLDVRTSWIDKYTTYLYSVSEDITCRRYELQPIPDYLRWYKTCEFHYLPLEERSLLEGPWDDIPAAFLPSRILDLCFNIIQHPSDVIIHQISLLSWTVPREVREYYVKIYTQVENQIRAEIGWQQWKSHHLFKTHNKAQLEAMCRDLKLPVTSALLKHDLVALICEKQGEASPAAPTSLYSGNLSSIPSTTTGIQRLTVPVLRAILKYHGHPPFGSKSELELKVFLLRQGKGQLVTSKEERQLKDLIHMAYQVIFQQRYLNVSSHIYRKRKYTLQTGSPHFVSIPSHMKSESDFKLLFQVLLELIEERQNQEDNHVWVPNKRSKDEDNSSTSKDDLQLAECITQIGSKVMIHWSNEEIGETGWKEGWYDATVQKYCEESDIMLTVCYKSEPYQTYDEELLPLLSNDRIKLSWSPL